MEKCPACGKEYYRRPYKNFDGSINWKNTLLPDWYNLFIIVSILLIIFGVKVMIEDSKYCLADPCGYADDKGCNQYQTNYLNLTIGSSNNLPLPSRNISSDSSLNR